MPLENVFGHDQGKLSGRLNIELFKVSDECLVCTSCNADPDLASGFFDCGKPGLEAALKRECDKDVQNPGLTACRDLVDLAYAA